MAFPGTVSADARVIAYCSRPCEEDERKTSVDFDTAGVVLSPGFRDIPATREAVSGSM